MGIQKGRTFSIGFRITRQGKGRSRSRRAWTILIGSCIWPHLSYLLLAPMVALLSLSHRYIFFSCCFSCIKLGFEFFSSYLVIWIDLIFFLLIWVFKISSTKKAFPCFIILLNLEVLAAYMGQDLGFTLYKPFASTFIFFGLFRGLYGIVSFLKQK